MADEITPLVRNILRVYRSATVVQSANGLAWYADARGIAEDFAQAHGVTVEIAAGVIAALSPLNSYGANLNLARRFLASGGTMDSGYLSVGLAKARAIYAGAEILPTLKSEKVSNFYRSIISAGQDGVTIDRHAYALAANTREDAPKLTGARYARYVEAYERAASRVGIPAAQVQAVTWVVWRQRYWAEGAFDPKA